MTSGTPTSAAAAPPGTADTLPVDEAAYARIRDFLFNEAALLDQRRYADWFGLLTSDIRYRVAAHATRAAGAEPKEVLILDDAAADIEVRLKQISNPNLTYSENPAPLMRRFVNNIRVQPGTAPDEFVVESYVLMYRNGGTMAEPFISSIVRRDIVRRVDGALRLASRIAHLDQTVIAMPNLASFV
jgi:3-phenylpropionate/cinnamic acid dioxygenase small subunit